MLILWSCDHQMTLLRRWALSRARPLLRGQAPQLDSTGLDWASTRSAQPSISPSWAPLSQGPWPEAPLCSPHVRDHTPWISLRCVPVWSPHWHANDCWNLSADIQASHWDGRFGETSSFCLIFISTDLSLRRRTEEGFFPESQINTFSFFVFFFLFSHSVRVTVVKTNPGLRIWMRLAVTPPKNSFSLSCWTLTGGTVCWHCLTGC